MVLCALRTTSFLNTCGVWTSQSKGCGYGDRVQFEAAMADMKSADTALTNASRDEVERKKQDQSPLATPD